MFTLWKNTWYVKQPKRQEVKKTKSDKKWWGILQPANCKGLLPHPIFYIFPVFSSHSSCMCANVVFPRIVLKWSLLVILGQAIQTQHSVDNGKIWWKLGKPQLKTCQTLFVRTVSTTSLAYLQRGQKPTPCRVIAKLPNLSNFHVSSYLDRLNQTKENQGNLSS